MSNGKDMANTGQGIGTAEIVGDTAVLRRKKRKSAQ